MCVCVCVCVLVITLPTASGVTKLTPTDIQYHKPRAKFTSRPTVCYTVYSETNWAGHILNLPSSFSSPYFD